MITDLINDLREIATPERAKQTARFFKNGKGEYGEGDIFIGVSNPQVRETVKKYYEIPIDELQDLLESNIHEFRFAALVILVYQFKKHKNRREELFNFYLQHLKYINNWDLVDCSCRDIVGAYLFDKDRSILDEMALVPHLWTQRVAIISTWYFIREKQFDDTLRISELFINHKHDLIHKATGWMLREVWSKGGKQKVENFLEKHIREIPRTMLRYAIEKMPVEQKRALMTM